MSIIIGIAGPSGGGKTTVTQRLKAEVEKRGNSISIICHDNYYHDQSDIPMEKRELTNFDHPFAFETDLLVEHLNMLHQGVEIQMPTYDFTTHTRSEKTETIKSNDVIIVEGILTLENEQLCNMYDLAIYVDTDADECLIRRIERDTKERARSLESILNQYRKTVKPMLHEFVEPSKRNAHIIVPANKDISKAIELISNHLNNII